MKRIEAGLIEAVDRYDIANSQQVLKALLDGDNHFITSYPSGVPCIITTGKLNHIPADWQSFPNVTLSAWNAYILNTNNDVLIDRFVKTSYT